MGETNTSTSSRRYRRRTVTAPALSINGNRGQAAKPSHGRRTSDRKKHVLLLVQQLSVFAIPPQFPIQWIVSNSLDILIEFLLFSRGLFPLTVAEIKETARVHPRCPRKVLLANTQVQTLSRQILLFSESPTQDWGARESMDKLLPSASFLMISLGPSLMRCQEFYLLDLRKWPMNTEEEDGGPKDSSQASRSNARLPPREVLARRLLPRWMSAEIPTLPSQSHKFQLYVSLWMNPQQQEAYYNGTVSTPSSTADFTHPSLLSHHEAGQRMPGDMLATPEWIPCSSPFPRLGQRCNSRRQPSIVIQPIAPATHTSESAEGTMMPLADLPFVRLDPSSTTTTGSPTWSTVGQWFSLRSSVKGFRLDR